MDKKITDIFPWQHGPWVDRSAVSASNDVKASNSLSNQMVLCLDRNPSGGDFSFDMMVYSLLAKGSSVILLAFNHPKQHYELILHKNVSKLYFSLGIFHRDRHRILVIAN